MTLPAYPDNLPFVSITDNFGRTELHAPVIVTQVSDGPDLMRVQSQTRIKKLAYTLRFTDAQYATWETFVENTLSQATQRFTMSVPAVARTFETRTVYIDQGQWTDKAVADFGWDVSFTLCVLPAS